MKYVNRLIEKEILKAAKAFPSLLVTGPRRAGKTTLLRKMFPKADYALLEDLDTIARVKEDPRSFIESCKGPIILDEIQNVPDLFNYVRTIIDKNPKRYGQWIFTGSQEAPLMQGVSESMTGRVAVFQLLPLAKKESSKVSAFKGGFPEVIDKPTSATTWFRSYTQTYLERDVRAITSIRDLSTFRRFLSILASRSGSMLNKTDIATPLGVSVPTVTEWLSILEITGQIIVVPPFYENFGKRLVKSPKIYFTDTGLLSYLLGFENRSAMEKSTFYGSIFEGFVASEIVKLQLGSGKTKNIYYFRNEQGLEVDFIVPKGAGEICLVEVKTSRTLKPAMAKPLQRLSASITNMKVRQYVVHPDPIRTSAVEIKGIAKGVKALPCSQLGICV
jgi:uncharacterized protein